MAKAIDGQGAQTSSVTRTVTISDTNAAPTISITAPSGGANFPTAPAGFTFTATAGAGESNGWVARVEFYVNGSLVSTDTSGPWSYPVAGLANGTYQLTAKAVDQLGGETSTAPITVTVGTQPKLHFIHVDHLNTPRAIYDDHQQLTWRWEQQEPFGVNVPDENPVGIGTFDFALRFPGQYFDKETALAYNYFRSYDAALGRYTRADPSGIYRRPGRRSVLNHVYAYAAGAPILMKDPLGLDPGDKFPSERAAAEDAAAYVRRIFSAQIWEFGGWIYLNSDCRTYSYTQPRTSHLTTQVDLGPTPNGVDVTADYHSHTPNLAGTDWLIRGPVGGLAIGPNQNQHSEQWDVPANDTSGTTGYLIAPNGTLEVYEPPSKRQRQHCTC